MNIVLSGPSGTKKGTLTEMLLKNSGFKKFTTCTTRKPRDGEKNGFYYYFLDEEKFLKLVKSGEMFNVRKYGGNYYGSFEAYNELLKCIETFKNNSLIKSKEKIKKVITEFLLDFSKILSQHSGVEKVFNAEVAKKWDDKAEFVVYYGIKNPIKSEIMASISDGMTIADIGCGVGKIIQRIDNKVDGCNIAGLDISPDMIQVAENKIFI